MQIEFYIPGALILLSSLLCSTLLKAFIKSEYVTSEDIRNPSYYTSDWGILLTLLKVVFRRESTGTQEVKLLCSEGKIMVLQR